MNRKTCLLATLILSAFALNAAPITLINGDFQGGVNNGTDLDPNGWTTTEAANKVYAYAGVSPITSTVLHFKDIVGSSSPQTSVLQNLSANNPGLTAASYGNYTVILDLGWRTDKTAGGTPTSDATLRFSLVDFNNPTIVFGYSDFTLTQRPTPLYNSYALTEDDRAINITYNNNQSGLDSANIGLLITRTDGASTGTENESVMWMDNLTLTAVLPLTDPQLTSAPNVTVENHGVSAAIEIPFSNGGNTNNLYIPSVTVSGPDAAFVTSATADSPVAPGASGMIHLAFDPTFPGGGSRGYQVTLTVASNDPSGDHVITVNVNVISPFAGVAPAALDYGVLASGAGVQNLAVTLTNSSAQPLTINGITVTGADAAAFTPAANPGTVAGLSSMVLNVAFDPSMADGNVTAALNIATDAGNQPNFTVPLSATVELDLDGDGLLDSWETAYGLDPNDNGSVNPNNGPDGDPDGDGFPNRDEQLLGSSPSDAADPDSRPWTPRPAKTHLLVISAHPDDEGIFFGGLLPYATQVRRLNTVLVDMVSDRVTKDLKIREAELRNAVWKYGLRSQPVFARFLDHADLPGGRDVVNTAWDAWDGNLTNGVADLNENGIPDGREVGTRYLAEQIRRYRPEVVASHDTGGEYGHGAHQATSLCTIDAFTMAADPALEIAGLPPWQAKKLYIHRYGTNRLFHDFWTLGTIDDGGVMKSPLQVANEGLDFHVSQGTPNVSTVYAAGEVNSSWGAHPSEWWGLYASTVGPDSVRPDFVAPDANNVPMTYSGWARGDFFENLTIYPDQDFDELPDDWELAHFAGLAAADPLADDDGDGLSNRDEFIAGLDPKHPDRSNLAIAADGTTVDFSVPAANGAGYAGLTRRYRLRFSPDLLDWHTVVAEGIADGTPLTHAIVEGGERGFYRIEITIE